MIALLCTNFSSFGGCMSTPKDQPLQFRLQGEGALLRLEVSWSGDADPPWFGGSGLRSSVISAVICAAEGVEGVRNPRASLSSSSHLRVWVSLHGLMRRRATIQENLVAAVRGVLTTARVE